MNCEICPMKCKLTIVKDGKTLLVEGNRCPQGEKYALKEIEEPSRVLFSRVLLDGGPMSRLHVKTDRVVPNSLKNDLIEIIEKTRVKAPVIKGDIIIANILDTGINVIAARRVKMV